MMLASIDPEEKETKAALLWLEDSPGTVEPPKLFGYFTCLKGDGLEISWGRIVARKMKHRK